MKKTEPIPPQTQYASPTSTGSAGSGYGQGPDTSPGYEVHFNGAKMSKPIKVTGPHTFGLLQPDGSELKVSLTRNDPIDGKPSLNITFG
jgi:hypothetical protein